MTRKSWATVALLAVTVIATAATTLHASSHGHDDQAVRSVIKQYEVALNASDPTAILALYSKSPVFMPPNEPAKVGREMLRAGYEGALQVIDLDIEFTISEVEVHGDTAWARTSSAGELKFLKDGTVRQEEYKELFVLKREAGDWKIHRYMYSSDVPKP